MGANKHAEIVAAAVQLFQQKGYHATSMQDIADAVELQKGSLYHYIGSKDELLVNIIREAIAQYNRRLAEVTALDLPVLAKLQLAVRGHLQSIAENLGTLTIFLRESYALQPEQQRLLSEETARYNQMFEALYAQGVAAGEVRDLDPKLATRTLLGACNWFYRWYRPDGAKTIPELADFIVDLLFRGVATIPFPIMTEE